MIRSAREAIGGTEQADRKNRREPDRLDTNRRVRGGELRELERAIGVDVEAQACGGLVDAIERERGESVRGACFVGDSLKDLQAARDYGCKPILVLTGKGEKTLAQLQMQHSQGLLRQTQALALLQQQAQRQGGHGT